MMSRILLGVLLTNIFIASTKICALATECGGRYNDQSGVISSPGFPNDYVNNLSCHYYIETSPLYSVNIAFLSFSTEICCDWVQVYCSVGPGNASPKFYGKTLPPYLSIQSCSLVSIEFYSDSSTTDKGFSLNYKIEDGPVGGLSLRPLNVFVDWNTTDSVVLGCSSHFSRFNAYPWWSFSSNGSSPRLITSSNCSLFTTASSTLYSPVRQYPSGGCNLTISTAYLASIVGVYTCTDSTLDSASAVVVPIGRPMLTSDVDLSSRTAEVVRNDIFNVTCSMKAQSLLPSIRLQLRMTTSSEQDYLNFNWTSDTAVSVTATARPEFLPAFTCDVCVDGFPNGCATNQPVNFSAIIPGHQVLFWPEEDSMKITGDNNGKVSVNSPLTCYVPSNPPATYQWDLEATGSQYEGPTLYVTRSGVYNCTARNFIRGRLHRASKSIYIAIEDQFNLLALIVGVVLGAAVLIPMMLMIVVLIYLCRRDKSIIKDVPISKSQAEPSAPGQESLQSESKSRNMYEMTASGSATNTMESEAATKGKETAAYDNTIVEVYEKLDKEESSSEGVRV